jgi:hypothetical protein
MAIDHKRFLERVSHLQTFYALLPPSWQTAAVAAASAVMGYLGLSYGGLTYGGFYYAGIGAVLTFACGMLGLFFYFAIGQQTRIFERLSVRDIGISDAGSKIIANILKEFRNLTMNVVLQNNCHRNIFFKIHRADLSILNVI